MKVGKQIQIPDLEAFHHADVRRTPLTYIRCEGHGERIFGVIVRAKMRSRQTPKSKDSNLVCGGRGQAFWTMKPFREALSMSRC